MPDPKPYRPPYAFSVTIGETCNRKMRTFQDLAEKLRMPVEDLMRQCNGHASPSKALRPLPQENGLSNDARPASICATYRKNETSQAIHAKRLSVVKGPLPNMLSPASWLR
jgi:hypothetical protein